MGRMSLVQERNRVGRVAGGGRRRPSRWVLALVCLVVMTTGIAADAKSPVDSDPSPEAKWSSDTIYGNNLRPLVEERDGVQTLNIYGPGNRIVAQVVRDGDGREEVHYLLADQLGSTRVVLEGGGEVVGRYDYTPYGETTVAGSDGAGVRYGYTGHPSDGPLGNYHTPQRVYDPTLGRFLSVDPMRSDASPYVYAGENPVILVDPTGGVKLAFYFVDDKVLAEASQGAPAAILELYGRPRTRSRTGITRLSALKNLGIQPTEGQARHLANDIRSGTGKTIERTGEAVFLIGPETKPADFRALTDGMHMLEFTRLENDAPQPLFEDITVVAGRKHAGVAEGFAAALQREGFPKPRLFIEKFDTGRVRDAKGNAVEAVKSVKSYERTTLPSGEAGWASTKRSPAEYLRFRKLPEVARYGGSTLGQAGASQVPSATGSGSHQAPPLPQGEPGRGGVSGVWRGWESTPMEVMPSVP